MGCDIHAYAEIYSKKLKKWKFLELPKVKCTWCKGKGVNKTNGKEHKCWQCEGTKLEAPRWYDGRCYDDFAILADVRNSAGFAPIADPKGVPKDASKKYLKKVEQYGGDGHSHSWVTLQELLAFDWNQTIKDYTGRTVTYKTCANNLWNLTIPQMMKVCKQHDVLPDELRLVFYFDN